MPGDTEEPIAAAMQAIVAYLRLHPLAADTVGGIARWWLAESGPSAKEDVEQALCRLVASGVVDAWDLPDGTLIYGLPDGARQHREGEHPT